MINVLSENCLTQNTNKYDCIIIQLNFEVDQLNEQHLINQKNKHIQNTIALIERVGTQLKDGGLLYIYGLPKYLPFLSCHLNDLVVDEHHFLFKYWIAIACKAQYTTSTLPNSHMGLLMYLKTRSLKKTTPFPLQTKIVRIPHRNCIACEKNVKDWGGKKHLMNPLGTAISDVWSDLSIDLSKANQLPDSVLDRIHQLLPPNANQLLLVQQTDIIEKQIVPISFTEKKSSYSKKDFPFLDKILNVDCIQFMKGVKEQYPDGIYDLVFADPPYNLAKNYSQYKDDKTEKDYLDWCDQWLQGMYDILRPGGALLVLNIPKWSVYHHCFLASKMHFRHWIVWDALSTPSGKFMPAHYSLLYFTKPHGEVTNHYANYDEIVSRNYCLRASCIKKRKQLGNTQRQTLTNIWQDIHRIKHKKDRDNHPCQLPNKLMERIIQLFSKEEDLVFDPFGGAGTTAIVAKLLNRHFTLTELAPEYYEVANNNLNRIVINASGKAYYQRSSLNQKKRSSRKSNKTIEQTYIQMCLKHGKTFDLKEIQLLDNQLYKSILDYKQGIKYLKKIGNRFLENEKLLSNN